MKISEMTTDQAADVLMRIADPAANIMHDDGILQVLDQLAHTDSENPLKYIADNLPKVVGVLLKAHREDTYEIIAALCDKTAQEVAEQKITATILDVKNSVDGDLIDFFGSLK